MKHLMVIAVSGLLAALVVSCSKDEDAAFEISSNSFEANGPLPAAYSCDGKAFGEGYAPELHWTAGPEGTQSYAIVFKDMSIINGTNPDPNVDHGYHWMMWDIPAGTMSMPENLSADQFPAVMNGAQQLKGGTTGGYGYLGPCPSWQTHCDATVPAVEDVYSFTIYALNVAQVTLPAADTTMTFVRQMDYYFIANAIATAEIQATSSAVPTSIPFPCP